MSEEKKLILKMLKDGKINEDEAMKLLDAVKETPEEATYAKESKGPNIDTKEFEKNIENWAQKLAAGIEGIFQKVGEKVSKLDLDYDFDLSYEGDSVVAFGKQNAKVEKRFAFNVEAEEEVSLVVNNRNGAVKVVKADTNEIEVLAMIKYNDRLFKEDYEFIKCTFENSTVEVEANPPQESRKDGYSVNIIITVPEKEFDNISLNTINGQLITESLTSNSMEIGSVNGSISTGILEADKIYVHTVNGAIELDSILAAQSDINTVNGRIIINSADGKLLKVETVNGRVEIEGLEYEDITIETLNGRIVLEGALEETNKLSVSSLNGRVELEVADSVRETKLTVNASSGSLDNLDYGNRLKLVEKSKRQLIAQTDGYTDAEEKMDIEISVQNGKIDLEI